MSSNGCIAATGLHRQAKASHEAGQCLRSVKDMGLITFTSIARYAVARWQFAEAVESSQFSGWTASIDLVA